MITDLAALAGYAPVVVQKFAVQINPAQKDHSAAQLVKKLWEVPQVVPLQSEISGIFSMGFWKAII